MMTTTSPITAEALARMPDGERFELVRGELRPMVPHTLAAGIAAGTLIRRLSSFVRANGGGLVGPRAGFVLRRDPDTVLGPDVSFVRAERVPPPEAQDGFGYLAPDLAVEILAPTDAAMEMGDKILIYLEAGVRLVWVVDPRRRTVTVYAPDRTARILLEDETLDGGDVLPGFAIPVAELFA